MWFLLLSNALANPCLITGDDVEVGELLIPGGPAFAYAGAAPEATVTFDADYRAEAVLSGDGITLRVELSGLEIHPRKGVRLAPWLIASEHASLVPGEADDGRITVGQTRDQLGAIGLLPEEDVSRRVACDAFTLTPPDWDHYDEGNPGIGERFVYVTPASGLAPFRDERGDPIGQLRTVRAKVLDESGDELRIRVWSWGFTFTGWVDTADTTPLEPGGSMGMGARGTGGACGMIYAERRTCDVDLPLLVRVAGEVVPIGEMAAGTPFIVLPGNGAHVPMLIPDSWFVVYDGFETTKTGAELVIPADSTCL